MSSIFIIGNGYDVARGDTSYSHFKTGIKENFIKNNKYPLDKRVSRKFVNGKKRIQNA